METVPLLSGTTVQKSFWYTTIIILKNDFYFPSYDLYFVIVCRLSIYQLLNLVKFNFNYNFNIPYNLKSNSCLQLKFNNTNTIFPKFGIGCDICFFLFFIKDVIIKYINTAIYIHKIYLCYTRNYHKIYTCILQYTYTRSIYGTHTIILIYSLHIEDLHK